MPRRLGALTVLLLVSSGLAQQAVAASDPLRPRQWGLRKVRGPSAWSTARGRSVLIAVVDSGVDLGHADLRKKLVRGRDFVEDDNRPEDGDGHGTHVAGIAAAATGNGTGVSGVAPAAKIMPLRVLDDEGRGSAADVTAAIRWAADRGADVINLSLGDLGQPLFGPAFGEALTYAWQKGAIPVVATGNEYLLSSGYQDEPAIVVSATDRRDQKPSYSSGVGSARWGMSAPGGAGGSVAPPEDDILSTYPGGYAYLAGTSMAAPHVSGAAALLRSLGLSPKQTVNRLLGTAKDIGSSGPDATFGAGRLDVAAAVRGLGRARAVAPPSNPGAASPKAGAPVGKAAASPDPFGLDPGAAVSPSPSPSEVGEPSTDPASGRDLPPPEEGGIPMAVWVTGLVTVLLAVVIGWTLFRPNPPE